MVQSLNAQRATVRRNATSGYLTLLLSSLLGFVVTPLLLNRLGVERYGLWLLLLGLVGYMGLLETGVGLASVTRVAAVEEGLGAAGITRILSTSAVLYLLVSLVLLTVGAVAVLLLPHFFTISPHELLPARVALVLLASWQTITFLGNVYNAALLGTGRMYLVNLSGVVVMTIATLLQLLAVTAGAGLVGLAAVQLLAALGLVSWQSFQVRRYLPGVRVRLRLGDRATAVDLLSLGGRNAVTFIAGSLSATAGVIVVGVLLSPVAAATFAVSNKAAILITAVSTKAADALGPTYTHAANNADARRTGQLFSDGVIFTWLVALPASIGVVVFAGPLLTLWLRNPPEGSANVLVFLVLALIFKMPGYNAFQLLLNSEQAGLLARVSVVTGLLSLSSTIGLTLYLGLIGPAVGSLLLAVGVDLVLLPAIVLRIVGLPFWTFWGTVIGCFCVPVAAQVLFLTAVRIAWVPSGWGSLVVVSTSALVFWLTWWFIGASNRHRRLIVGSIPARFARAAA